MEPANLHTNLPIVNNKNFSELTTLGIGGPIRFFLEAITEEQLIESIKLAKAQAIPFLVVGGCSNLLVSDQGVDYLIIKNAVKEIKADGNFIIVSTGTNLSDLVSFAIENGLAGLEKLTGIPGTVGGAIYGNAGAYGQTISDHLIEVSVFNGQSVITLNHNQCNFSYRNSEFKINRWTVLSAKFELTRAEKEELKTQAKEILKARLSKYPPNLKCPGSFFKNIVASDLDPKVLEDIPQEKVVYGKIPAGYLLEEVGAKGEKLGGIEIAPYHANLFINSGHGTAADFYQLALQQSQKVKEKFDILLEPEVQLINLPPLKV